MGLRHILMVLSLLAFLSASAGGILYYSALRRAAFQEAERQSAAKTELIHKSVTSFLSEHFNTAATLAGTAALREALRRPAPDSLQEANAVLDHFNATLNADVCYLMNHQGITIASSNRSATDSFVGQSFAFRPYFRQALAGDHGAYLALGITSGQRGVYHSFPVYAEAGDPATGVAVIKSSIEKSEKELGLPQDDIVLITDPQGVIFIANRPEWLFQLAWELTPEQIARIDQERQFGPGPWAWIGLRADPNGHVLDREGERYMLRRAGIERFAGWQIVYLRNTRTIDQSVSAPLLSIVRPAAVLLSVLIGLAVLVLYQKASREIAQRRNAELALRQSETRYRSLYHHTPAMLHSIDPQGRLISVSDFWVETMGYGREELLGRPLTDFFTPESKHLAITVGMPQFFEKGFVKDLPYRMIKADGGAIDILLSAIADRDLDGRIQRSLAVCVDVTERNRAEAALREAKETLSHYSKELERQVRVRTGEITAILKYTPAVVYMKDIHGRYLLVNSGFEKLFGVTNDAVRGKSDEQLLPAGVARQFQMHDEKVLAEGLSLHVEEHVPQADGAHTYLSVKFPIYEESGQMLGVCGVATDITALKNAQEQLRRLSGAIMANQESERAAIARELHDELGQLLTALRMDAVWLQKRLADKDPSAAERAAAICTLVDTTIEEVRAMAIRLRPGVLDDLGLVAALEWYTSEFERRAEFACIFSHDPMPAIDNTTATAAYRIAQEALTNVARHARATRAEVDLRLRRQALCLTVWDDGLGFNPSTLSDAQMLGLAGMRERAALVGGALAVTSQPGQGTLVTLTVPLTNPMENTI
ncbi:MAG: PAS domain-containing protein [Desulfatitalea sp.]